MLERIVSLFDLGGPVALVLLFLSVVALTIILVKVWQFKTIQIGHFQTAKDALGFYRRGLSNEALEACSKSRNPVTLAVARAIRGHLRSLPDLIIREEVMRYGTDALESLRNGFRMLEMIASLSPLLGLLGTVLGMIDAFREMEQSGNQVNPAVLSGGIWEALLTTALGLIVAIVVVVVLGLLEKKVDRLSHEMSNIVTGIFTIDLSEDSTRVENAEPIS
ncbi:MAG: MotA/TolQ/ExbB proton channel family protein [Gammaproteobacteria bacterium]|nr:MotA/TolQ/ExbB proton channel family protein [Gammaproteobacteria bacterium]MCY4218227.1 MotA/TolQ/ExbB proton channel family protein [Gammaproteobacteria bacterium]MCY4275072.1 MotA/TolQ/ExbB proton channel family protein [Gammaproteobacteria bacterium]